VISSSGSDDDLIGGFRHGGWHLPYFDEIAVQWVVEGYQAAGGFLFGRRTHALLVGYCGSEHTADVRPVFGERTA
jgi:hypothetical protein